MSPWNVAGPGLHPPLSRRLFQPRRHERSRSRRLERHISASPLAELRDPKGGEPRSRRVGAPSRPARRHPLLCEWPRRPAAARPLLLREAGTPQPERFGGRARPLLLPRAPQRARGLAALSPEHLAEPPLRGSPCEDSWRGRVGLAVGRGLRVHRGRALPTRPARGQRGADHGPRVARARALGALPVRAAPWAWIADAHPPSQHARPPGLPAPARRSVRGRPRAGLRHSNRPEGACAPSPPHPLLVTAQRADLPVSAKSVAPGFRGRRDQGAVRPSPRRARPQYLKGLRCRTRSSWRASRCSPVKIATTAGSK